MHAFVAGATGYTGRAVVRALRERGIETIAHVRPDSSRLDAHRAQFEGQGVTVDTTPWQLAAMTDRFAALKPAVVFALLGTTRKRGDSYEAVDYGLTKLLIDAAVAAGARPRFVYLSSIGADKPRGNAYLAARHNAEAALRDSGLPYTIARPSFITGPDRDESRPFERLGATVADGLLGAAGSLGARRLRDRYRSTDAPTLAATLVRLALDPNAENQVVDGAALR